MSIIVQGNIAVSPGSSSELYDQFHSWQLVVLLGSKMGMIPACPQYLRKVEALGGSEQ